MDKRIVYSAAAFAVAAGGYVGLSTAGVKLPIVPPLYYYGLEAWGYGHAADLVGIMLAYLFVAMSSLLFFGRAAPLAMALEGLKYASLYTYGRVYPFDFLFVVPQLVAVYAGLMLSANAEADFDHKGSVFKAWQLPLVIFVGGAALALALYLLRPPFVSG